MDRCPRCMPFFVQCSGIRPNHRGLLYLQFQPAVPRVSGVGRCVRECGWQTAAARAPSAENSAADRGTGRRRRTVAGLLLRRGVRVRCLARRPERLHDRESHGVEEAVSGDVLNPATLSATLHGVETACNFVHLMGDNPNFATTRRRGFNPRGPIHLADAAAVAIAEAGGTRPGARQISVLPRPMRTGRRFRSTGHPRTQAGPIRHKVT
jgi:hypothetical protein